jgi:SAM-dependent methyltransferase
MPELTDYRARILSRYVSTHESVSGAASGLDRRRPFLDKLVAEHFPPERNASILDLGCGHGAIVWAARRAGYTNITGVDASPEQVAMAKQLGVEGVREGDLMQALAQAQDASLDAVVLFDLYHYFTRGEQAWIADQVRRALKPGGRFILHIPNGEAIFAGRMRYWDFLADFSYTRASIGQLLRAYDFSEVRCFEDRPVPHGLKSIVRLGLWHVTRLWARLVLAAETGETGGAAIFSQVMLVVARK